MNNLNLNPTQLPFQTWSQIPGLPDYNQIFPFNLLSSNLFYIKEEFDIKKLKNSM